MAFLLAFVLSSCEHLSDYLDDRDPSKPDVKEFATGLSTPIGLEMDKYHRLWVTEAGTGMNDGEVSVITQNGKVYTAIEGFPSVIGPEGDPAGLNHLLYEDGSLWILHGISGRLYKANVANFVPGDIPIQASDLTYYEIGDFVTGQGFEESNMYKLTRGPEGDLFIVDAGANSIIRRDAETGDLSVFVTFDKIKNPTPVGPEFIDPVPTGIVYEEGRFLVTTLTGFPFPEGQARIYEVSAAGDVSLYQEGFTTLVDIEMGMPGLPLVLQYAASGEAGWMPGTGKIIQATGDEASVLRSGLSFASDMELVGARNAYVTNLAEGKVLKVKY